MNFFQQIFDLADGVDLSIKIKRKNDKLTVSMLPGTSGNTKPLIVVGTPAELDAGIEMLFVNPINEVKDLVSNAADFKKAVTEKKEVTENAARPAAAAKTTKKDKAGKSVNQKTETSGKKSRANKETSATESSEDKKTEETEPTFF